MAYVIIALCFGLAGGIVGKLKGSSFIALVPDLGARAVLRPDRGDRLPLRARGAAPASARSCGRVTKIYDAICMRCGTELEFPDVAIAPESWQRTPRRRPPLSARTSPAH